MNNAPRQKRAVGEGVEDRKWLKIQVRGMQAFVQRGCANCPRGPMLGDYQLHAAGVADNSSNTASDTGANGPSAFRTPSLRNVALTGPYLHSGTLTSLAAVLNFYDPGRGGDGPTNPHVSARQRDPQFPTRATNKPAIVAFLQSLTATSYDCTVPATVPGGLPVGSMFTDPTLRSPICFAHEQLF